MKICSKYKKELIDSDFYKDKAFKSGYRSVCKKCDILKSSKWNKVNKDKHTKQQKSWREANRQASRDQRNKYVSLNKEATKNSCLKSSYGITIEDYKRLAKNQNNKCAVCEKEVNTYLYVDHCHVTGKIRGLLCRNCNSGIGLLGDTYEKGMLAAKYLKLFENSNG